MTTITDAALVEAAADHLEYPGAWITGSLGMRCKIPKDDTPCRACINGALQLAQDRDRAPDYSRYVDPQLGRIAEVILLTARDLSGYDVDEVTGSDAPHLHSFKSLIKLVDGAPKHSADRYGYACFAIQVWNDDLLFRILGEQSDDNGLSACTNEEQTRIRAEAQRVVVEVLRETAKRLGEEATVGG